MRHRGPHCQCRSLVHDWRARNGAVARPPLQALGAGEIQVPRWVVAGNAEDVQAGGNAYFRPRCQSLARQDAAPPGMPRAGMFRSRLMQGRSRCQVPQSVYEVHREIDEALQSGERFLDALFAENQAILGSVGTNVGMSKLLAAIVSCFDWPQLILRRPRADQVQALLYAYKALLPFLKRTLWQ